MPVDGVAPNFRKEILMFVYLNTKKNKIRETPWGTMTYINYKHKIEFGKREYDNINEYCLEKPLDWTASVWDLNSLNFLLQ